MQDDFITLKDNIENVMALQVKLYRMAPIMSTRKQMLEQIKYFHDELMMPSCLLLLYHFDKMTEKLTMFISKLLGGKIPHKSKFSDLLKC